MSSSEVHIGSLDFSVMMMSDARRSIRLINRELSWLDFNARVLALAEKPSTPLLERAKFLAIFASNLDEFYMVRVGGLKRQQAAGLTSRSPDGLTPKEQLAAISNKALPLVERHARLFVQEVMPALYDADVRVLRWDDLDDVERKELEEFFSDHIFPVVTPLAVGPGHPFPYISNRSLNLAVLVRDPVGEDTHFARVKVPPLLPRFVSIRDETVFVPLEDVIAANLHELFPGMDVVEYHAFRVTRNVDFDVTDDGADDLLQALEDELRRTRFSPAVRLEVETGMPTGVLELLMRELQVNDRDVHSLPGPLDLSGLWELNALDRPDLKDEPFQPVTSSAFASVDDTPPDIFTVLRDRDVLVQHPYESFASSVLRFIQQAAADPDVLAIKQTLYRTSGESPIVNALIEAAEAGKQVVVLVEIKARFDERANISWARTLEQAGCHVVYGLVGLKTHGKLCLVVRQEEDGLRRYVHIGTGNYNPHTARVYEDLGLLSADPELGADVSQLCNFLTGYSRQSHYRSLLVAPGGMRERMIAMIQREARTSTEETPGRIIIKVNSLVDEAIINALYEASQKGVSIDLIVRGICALLPGVNELSDTISVKSILGRFLEHSRIFYFQNGGAEEFYIGSADLMHRNLDRRVEVLVKLKSQHVQSRLKELLELALTDNSSAWSLDAAGQWNRLQGLDGRQAVDFQAQLMREKKEANIRALAAAANVPKARRRTLVPDVKA